MENVVEILTNFGFPIVVALIAFWYINKREEETLEERKTTLETHKSELETMAEALNNNTLVMQKLVDTLDVDMKAVD